MNIYKNNIIWELSNMMPIILTISPLLYSVYDNNNVYKLLFIGMIFSNLFNVIVKEDIFRILYEKYGSINKNNEKLLPHFHFLGIGERPAKTKKIEDSFGMPSGHSQSVGFITGYIIAHNLNLQPYKYWNNKNWYQVIISILIMLFTMGGRLARSYHTVQQVVIGGIIGLLLGYWYYQQIKCHINKKL